MWLVDYQLVVLNRIDGFHNGIYFVNNTIFIPMFSFHHMPYSYAETLPLISRLIMRAFGGNEDI